MIDKNIKYIQQNLRYYETLAKYGCFESFPFRQNFVIFALNKYWCSVPHYLSDVRNIYIKADRFPLMMLTDAIKERKQI
jgi:predicted NAD-dependent protein-ADP-ribosyltransferase YbiA (DUF1768 family)